MEPPVDEADRAKRCTLCGRRKRLKEFAAHHGHRDGRQSACMDCRNAARQAKERARDTSLAVSSPPSIARWNHHGRVCDGCGQPETAMDSQGRPVPLSLYGNEAGWKTLKAVLCKLCSMGLSCARDDPGIVGRWLSILSGNVRQEIRVHVEE